MNDQEIFNNYMKIVRKQLIEFACWETQSNQFIPLVEIQRRVDIYLEQEKGYKHKE